MTHDLSSEEQLHLPEIRRPRRRRWALVGVVVAAVVVAAGAVAFARGSRNGE
ncbi:hypothetical protein [Dactylosporangium darangshiense]|uniref:hypothetical protein n=1 Tax=Dactylosporangium darangshiense TaxID=579108 RepID=UPI0031E6E1F4